MLIYDTRTITIRNSHFVMCIMLKASITRCDLSPRFFCTDAMLTLKAILR